MQALDRARFMRHSASDDIIISVRGRADLAAGPREPAGHGGADAGGVRRHGLRGAARDA